MRILASTTALPLFAPLSAVLVAWAGLTWIEPIPAAPAELLTVAPFLLLGIGAILAAYFKLSNAVLQFVLLVAAQLAVTYAGTQPAAEAARATGLAALLIPLGFAALSMQEDRGLLTQDGIVRWLALGLGAGLAVLVAVLAPDVVSAILGARVLPVPLPAPAAASTALAIAVSAFLFLRRGTPLEAGALAALVALTMALAQPPGTTAGILLLCAAGIILTVAVLQSGYRLALLDELTCLPGRRALELQLKRLPGPYAVAMVDVDLFKKFNDAHGHDVGDQALRMIARCLRQVGGGGEPYRYGGAVFAVLFPGRTADEAAPALEELRALIAATPFRVRGADRPKSRRARARRGTGSPVKALHLTVSLGLAERSETHRQPDAVIKAADKALDRAKSNGRNQLAR